MNRCNPKKPRWITHSEKRLNQRRLRSEKGRERHNFYRFSDGTNLSRHWSSSNFLHLLSNIKSQHRFRILRLWPLKNRFGRTGGFDSEKARMRRQRIAAPVRAWFARYLPPERRRRGTETNVPPLARLTNASCQPPPPSRVGLFSGGASAPLNDRSKFSKTISGRL